MVVQIASLTLVVKALDRPLACFEGTSCDESRLHDIELMLIRDGDGEIPIIGCASGVEAEYMGQKNVPRCRADQHIADLFGLRFYRDSAKDIDDDRI